METTGITTPGTTPYTAGQSNRAISSDFETFLRMLTVQVQNQDPLNPVEASDYAVQLATFSSVEQQVLTNDLLKGLSGQMNVSGLAQMGDWVGREVRATVAARFDGSPITIAPNPAALADRVDLVVRDAAGAEVQRMQIPVSAEPVQWAGVLPDGSPVPRGLYTFHVESWIGDEKALDEQAEVYSSVREVRSEAGEILLLLEGDVAVSARAVTALRDG